MTILQLQQGSPEWKAYRRDKIGGSSVAAIVCAGVEGVHTWSTPYQEWARLTGKLEPKDVPVTPEMQWGLDSEPMHRMMLGRELKTQVLQGPVVQDDEHPRFMASLDSVLAVDGKIAIAELKAPSRYTQDQWQDNVPLAYRIQVAWQAYVARADIPADDLIVSALIQPAVFYERQARSSSQEQFIFEKVMRFLDENVAKDIPPEPNAKDLGTIARLWPRDSGRVMQAGPHAIEIARKIRDLRKMKSEVESDLKDYEAEMKAHMGDATWCAVEPGFAIKYAQHDEHHKAKEAFTLSKRPLLICKKVSI